MKNFFKVFGLLFVLVIISLIAIPYIFKDDIIAKIQTEIDNNLDAEITISDVSLSMLKSFPSLHVELNDIAIVGKNEFEKDTLAYIGSFYTALDVKSVISGGQIEIESIVLSDSKFNALVLDSGKANWDIVKNQTVEVPEEEAETTEDSNFKLKFDNIRFENINIKYKDKKQNILFQLADFNLLLKGDFSAKQTNLDLESLSKGIFLDYEGNNYLKSAKLNVKAIINADLENMIFTFKDNSVLFNGFELGIDGNIAVKEDSYVLDLDINSKKTDFKTLLALVPDMFKKDMKDIKTTGKMIFNSTIKGEYKDDSMPAFNVKLKVDDASVKYADLNESVDDIDIDVVISNAGGSINNTIVNLKRFYFSVSDNPFEANMIVKTPVSDPQIKGVFKGVIDFAKLKNAIPLDSLDIAGIVRADIVFNGRMSSIEKERYEEFVAKGKLSLSDFEFKTPDIPKTIRIIRSDLNFTPQYITLNSLDLKIGKSDFNMSGRISNYIAYAMRNSVLKADFHVNSKLIDVNEFMSKTTSSTTTTTEESDPLSVIEIPANLDLKMHSNFAKMIYDKMPIENIKGLIIVKNSIAKLENLSMYMLKGSMVMNGSYSTANIKKPFYSFGLNINDFDVESTYHSLSIIKEMMPMALNCRGKVSANMKISGVLDSKMNPIMNTLNGNGALHSRELLITKNKTFDRLAKLLKNDKYKSISLSKFDIDFVIINGNIEVPPCKLKIANNESTFYGTQSVDGKMDFNLAMMLPKNDLGKEFTKYFDKLPGFDTIDLLDVGVKITGRVDSPNVKLDLSRATKQAKDAAEAELKRKGKKEIKKQVDKLKNKLFDLLK